MATSLVAKVLGKSGRFAKEEVSTVLENLSQKIDEVKGEVNNVIQKQYKEFLAVYADTGELMSRAQHVTEEMQLLEDRIENELLHQVKSATSEQRELSSRLETSEAKVELLRLLCKVYEDLQALDANIQCGQCVLAAKTLAQTESSVLATWESGCDLPIFEAIRAECIAQRGNLVYQLEDAWGQCVSFANLDSRAVQMVKREVSVPKTELRFSSASTGLLKLPVFHIVQGLQILGSMDRLLKSFGARLWQHILKPTIETSSIQPIFKIKQGITAVYFQVSQGETVSKTAAPAVLCGKLVTILKVVRDSLVDPTSTSGDSEPIRKLGDQLWRDMSHLIISHCLVHTIPKQSSELLSYQEVISCVSDFERQLAELGYIGDDVDALTQYAKDVNVHFANQKCQDLLVEARRILLTDMHTTLLIDDTKERGGLLLLDKPLDVDKEAVHERTVGFSSSVLQQTTHHFPACHVSKNVKELVDLAYKTLIEATESSQCGVQLFFAVRDMFELFRAVAPSYHKKILEELPQMAAIHHNNCMYIAHHLITLGHQFTNYLPWPVDKGTATFIDMVSLLRKCGEDCYLTQLRRQKSIILESLSTAENLVGAAHPGQAETIEKALKQVIQHLLYLSRLLWAILPVDVFFKTIGGLLNAALESIVKCVLNLQDISAKEAGYLHQLLSVVLNEAPTVFKHVSESAEVSKIFSIARYVKQWPRFEKLLVILEATLQTIVDMWGDGKTSFAKQFTVSEVRSLIRALFKNTDRRAEALAKIKTLSK